MHMLNKWDCYIFLALQMWPILGVLFLVTGMVFLNVALRKLAILCSFLAIGIGFGGWALT